MSDATLVSMRVSPRARSALTLLLTAGLLAAAGCREDPDVTAADERMCDATERLGDALRAFEDTEAESGNLAAARDELFDAMAEMTHASSDVAQANADAGNNPIKEFNENLQDTSDDATLSEAAEDMVVASGDFLADVKGLITDRDC